MIVSSCFKVVHTENQRPPHCTFFRDFCSDFNIEIYIRDWLDMTFLHDENKSDSNLKSAANALHAQEHCRQTLGTNIVKRLRNVWSTDHMFYCWTSSHAMATETFGCKKRNSQDNKYHGTLDYHNVILIEKAIKLLELWKSAVGALLLNGPQCKHDNGWRGAFKTSHKQETDYLLLCAVVCGVLCLLGSTIERILTFWFAPRQQWHPSTRE